MTLHTHRILCVVPENRVSGVATWWQANIDAGDDLSTWPTLNLTGSILLPSTHRWCGAALTDPQTRALLLRLCDLAGVAKPTLAQWNGWTGAQKRSWLAGVRDAIASGFGIHIRLADNEATWGDPDALLAALGLKRRQADTA